MQRKLPARVLRHTATPVRGRDTNVDENAEEWIEGEPGEGAEPVAGLPFACVLFLPQSTEGAGQEFSWRQRAITRPTLLYNIVRADGSRVDIGKDDELTISAPDLAEWQGGALARWQVDGIPQPFGPPGRAFACQATLKQVVD